MALYAVGDIQGCFDELRELLELISFDRTRDQLWLTGDLVNRGPQSLEVVRFVKNLGSAAITVLGNHDLHLLAVAFGHGKLHRQDTLHDILAAPDRDELLDWLRHRPLVHHSLELNAMLVHAGMPPQWDLNRAQACAHEVEVVLRSEDHAEFYRHMYGNEPNRWNDHLSGWARLRFITNCFTRLRFCDSAGHLSFSEKGPPGSQGGAYVPWFRVPGRLSENLNIVFGHWSTLGFVSDPGIYALDTGCVWGGRLTALHLENKEYLSLGCKGAATPGET